MTYKDKSAIVIEQLRADRDRLLGVFEKIIAEILDEAEYAYADFDRYKEDILCAELDELPDDDFRYGLERAVEIINRYRKPVYDEYRRIGYRLKKEE